MKIVPRRVDGESNHIACLFGGISLESGKETLFNSVQFLNMVYLFGNSFSHITWHGTCHDSCRCGIVLCSRDAKFAVDCDTCRLSYCLVCLASGIKDPCVRCGHRPSKRMEQLVHLRLKSIYKAFKSSSSGNSGGGGGDHSNSNITTSSHDNSQKDGRSRRNKATTLQDMVSDHDGDDDDPAMSMMIGTTVGVLPHQFCHDLEQKYLAEQKKADAAAEALLAELEEEETAIAQKKSKKKKKKERKNANKLPKPATKGNNVVNEAEKNNGDTETKIKTPQNDNAALDAGNNEMKTNHLSESDSADEAAKIRGKTGHKIQKALETKMDPVEKELVGCVNNADLDGIESILFRLKGLAGRAALRKNAKKALKRLKLELNQPPPIPLETKIEVPSKIDRKSTTAVNRSSSTIGKVPPLAADLRTSSKKTTKSITSIEKSCHNSTKTTHPKSSSRKNTGSNRCEAHVEIVSRLVGWMIGKNGQRIRDLMEESGAKIWIDQEKIKGQETRNIYISGNRKSVDQAVLLVNDVITNAPPPQGTTSNIAIATTSMANMTLSQKSLENPGETQNLVSPSTTCLSQSVLPGIVEVKSAWTKTAGSNRKVDKIQGTVPKPPALISSSMAVTTEKINEYTKAKPTSVIKYIGSGIYEQGPGLLAGVPKIAVETATPAVDASNQSNHRHKPTEVISEIVTCDVRFVPLLIGKRGWTIKNIQDDSGARVDIDQTVTPRQVRISGSKANVNKAVTMVRDVLSYPHAQLQSSSEGTGNVGNGILPELGTNMQLPEVQVPISSPTKQKLVAASAILELDVMRSNREGGNSNRVLSPPQVVGYAKTAISASSSLSSTPEPSMSSSSKGYIPSHLQNCPLLPPPAENYIIGNSASQPVERHLLQSKGGLVDELGAGGLWASAAVGPGARATVAPQAMYAGSIGQMEFQVGRPIAMSHGAPPQPQIYHIQQQGQRLQQYPRGNVNHNQDLIQQSLVPSGEILHRTALQANLNGGSTNRGSQFSHQKIGNNQQIQQGHSSLTGGLPYNLYSNDEIPAAQVIATAPLQDLMHTTRVGSGPAVSSPTRDYGFIDSGSRLWNSGNPANSSSRLMPRVSGLQPEASSGFTSNSIGFSSGHHQQNNGIGKANSIGYTNTQAIPSQQSPLHTNSLSLAPNTALNFSGSISSGLRNDDSRMIDSLFGCRSNAQSSNANATNSMLAGLKELSLPNEEGEEKSSGLWGSQNLTETWREGGSDNPNGSSTGNMFSNAVPNRPQGHPQESRFNWD